MATFGKCIFAAEKCRYDPEARIRPLEACCVEFFEELRDQNARLPNSKPVPDLFNFTKEEAGVPPSDTSLQT